MKDITRLAVLYSVFALIAIAVNISCQALVIWIYKGSFALQLSILVGTAAGLPVKYVLDKKYIFRFQSKNITHDSQVFMLYICMSVFTSAIFWTVEYGFHVAFGTYAMRYTGGVIGLMIGNIIKYRLDKKYVFQKRAA